MCLINTVFSAQFQESSSGKRYKFVVTGHGKYEKVSAVSDCSEDANCQSGKIMNHHSLCRKTSKHGGMFLGCDNVRNIQIFAHLLS